MKGEFIDDFAEIFIVADNLQSFLARYRPGRTLLNRGYIEVR